MEKSKIYENFEPSSYECNFDLDFDFRLSGFDFVLLALYAVFVMPSFLFFNLIASSFKHYTGRKKYHGKETEGMELLASEICLGPCCFWPKTPHD